MSQPVIPPAAMHAGGVVITSFGYLHGPPDGADIAVDVRRHFHDPHISPRLRGLTGQDHEVREHVLATPGALGFIEGVTVAATALLHPARTTGRPVRIAIGCSGGRHRSVVLADAIADRLAARGWRPEAEHRDVGKPVVRR